MLVLKDFLDEEDILYFTMIGLDVCFVNAIRRIILSDIDVCCIEFDSNGHDDGSINITVNTGRLHNEILKHRLSCIPVYIKNNINDIYGKEKDIKLKSTVQKFCDEMILEINVCNNQDTSIIVTSGDFNVKNIKTGEYIDAKKIFPPNRLTNDYIDFSRLRPKISDTIPGESLKLTAKFSVSNASKNSVHNVVSICSYSNSLDKKEIEARWKVIHQDLCVKDLSEECILFEKTNFYYLDANRYFIKDSFDFKIQSICALSNREILTLATYKLWKKCHDFLNLINTRKIIILISESTIPFCFDIQLYDEDYTFGRILEYFLYQKYYLLNHFSYCGFKKFHPHDIKSVIRIAFTISPNPNDIYIILAECCQHALQTIENIQSQIV